MSDLMRDWIVKNDWDISAVEMEKFPFCQFPFSIFHSSNFHLDKMEQFPFCPENYTFLPIGVRVFLLGETGTTLPTLLSIIMTCGLHIRLLDLNEKIFSEFAENISNFDNFVSDCQIRFLYLRYIFSKSLISQIGFCPLKLSDETSVGAATHLTTWLARVWFDRSTAIIVSVLLVTTVNHINVYQQCS